MRTLGAGLSHAWGRFCDSVRSAIALLPWVAMYRFQRTVLTPLWRTLSPLGVPAATAFIVVTTLFFHPSGVKLTTFKGASMAVFRLLCAGAAAVSTAVLLVHAYNRIYRLEVRACVRARKH